MPDAASFQVEDWLEWEERVLRPAIHTRHSLKLQTALSQLDQACVPGQGCLGHTLTLADIAIFSSLHLGVEAEQVCTAKGAIQTGH